MTDAFIIGIHSTPAGRLSESIHDLAGAAITGALQDAGVEGDALGHIWFANAYMEYWGQRMCKGQVCTAPLVASKLIPASVPITNVEGACASGTLALNGAMTTVLSGRADVALAVGVEKMWDPEHPRGILEYVGKSADQIDTSRGVYF
jgi:acetyl-CoA acetyltransferase